jgi:hypothetical protein
MEVVISVLSLLITFYLITKWLKITHDFCWVFWYIYYKNGWKSHEIPCLLVLNPMSNDKQFVHEGLFGIVVVWRGMIVIKGKRVFRLSCNFSLIYKIKYWEGHHTQWASLFVQTPLIWYGIKVKCQSSTTFRGRRLFCILPVYLGYTLSLFNEIW